MFVGGVEYAYVVRGEFFVYVRRRFGRAVLIVFEVCEGVGCDVFIICGV